MLPKTTHSTPSFAQILFAVALCLIFAIWNYLIVLNGLSDPAGRQTRALITAASTPLGPMTGAISRNLQGCCLENSLGLLRYALPILAAGVVIQFMVSSGSLLRNILRWIAWTIGWLAWFGLGLVSFLHALE